MTNMTHQAQLVGSIQSASALIQAAILLPAQGTSGSSQTSGLTESEIDKRKVGNKISNFGSKFGKIDFPPKLTPVPAKPVLFDIGG